MEPGCVVRRSQTEAFLPSFTPSLVRRFHSASMPMFPAQGPVPTQQHRSLLVVLFLEGIATEATALPPLWEGQWVMEGARLKESEGEKAQRSPAWEVSVCVAAR